MNRITVQLLLWAAVGVVAAPVDSAGQIALASAIQQSGGGISTVGGTTVDVGIGRFALSDINLKVRTVSVDDAATDAPDRYELSSGYPNPATVESTVPFSLPEAARVRIDVLDVMGRRMTTVKDETLQAGHHTAVVRPDGWPAGLYFIRLQTDHYQAVRPLIVVPGRDH